MILTWRWPREIQIYRLLQESERVDISAENREVDAE